MNHTNPFSFNVFPAEHASCPATSVRWLKLRITPSLPLLPKFPISGPLAYPSFPLVLRKMASEELAQSRRAAGTTTFDRVINSALRIRESRSEEHTSELQ